MKKFLVSVFVVFVVLVCSFRKKEEASHEWIRINQLGYTPNGIKVAVWCSKGADSLASFSLVDSATGKDVMVKKAGKNYGSYGPFNNTCRLNFTSYNRPGTYYLKAGRSKSPSFRINANVYKGGADFCLQY